MSGFNKLVFAVILVWLIKPFVSEPVEVCFVITATISVVIIKGWKGVKRIAGIAILLVSIVGLVNEFSLRLEEMRATQIKSERVRQNRQQSNPTNHIK